MEKEHEIVQAVYAAKEDNDAADDHWDGHRRGHHED